MKLKISCIVSFALPLAGFLVAQEPAKEASSVKSQQETTLTGCLNKGPVQGSVCFDGSKDRGCDSRYWSVGFGGALRKPYR